MSTSDSRPLCAELADALLCWQTDGAWIDQAEQSRLIARFKAGPGCPVPLFRRAATLLQQLSAPAPALVPVAVSERPWEKGGWTDLDGECWWCPPDGPAYWSLANPAMVYGGWLLPAHAIPIPTIPPQP